MTADPIQNPPPEDDALRDAIAAVLSRTFAGHGSEVDGFDRYMADAVLAMPVVGDRTVADCIAIAQAVVEYDYARQTVDYLRALRA